MKKNSSYRRSNLHSNSVNNHSLDILQKENLYLEYKILTLKIKNYNIYYILNEIIKSFRI